MAKRERLGLSAVRTEGAILPASILQRIHREDSTLEGLKPEQYGLAGDRLREAASRAWNALQGPWSNFKAERAKLAASETGTSVTRNRWINPILRELHFGPVEAAGDRLNSDDKEFPVSHLYGHAPLHLIGCNLDLDRRTPGAVGAARMSPHGLVQSCLNARKENLWGYVTNGLKWRVLRDDNSLSRQSMVEFDLEAIFEGQLYDEFLLFFLVCHRSRLESETPEQCWLEKWSQAAGEEGKRALDTLRDGVQKSIEALGQGFLRHPANNLLRERIRSGELDKQDYYRQLLRMVYRFLFLFVAEDRGLLLDPNGTETAKALYADEFSTQRLRMLAERMRGSSRHHDLFSPIKLILGKLGQPNGCRELALPALGGFLFSESTAPDLDSSEIANADLLEAIRSLAVTREGGRLARVDYKNLGTEELGSVYESLLELHPELASDGTWFELKSASGNERKTSGSYYTPDSLIQCLLDTALDPVVEDAVKRAGTDSQSRAQAILGLRVIDPAVGSGHFLIAAAHRLAKRLAQVRTGEDEPSPNETRHALREVVGKCLYGIDLNPMAAELCKVSLWIEALEPGRPLTFLDHHVVVGNSLLGTTPELIAKGIPDAAFDAIEGDDKALCAVLKKQNKQERGPQGNLFDPAAFAGKELLRAWQELELLPDETLEDIRTKDKTFRAVEAALQMLKLMADAWCAAFVLPKVPPKPNEPTSGQAITTATLRRLSNGLPLSDEEIQAVQDATQRFAFLHPHITFPEVFAPRERRGSGFDLVLGNPPWERVKLQEKEFFAERRPEIASARNKAERDKMIKELSGTALHKEFLLAKRDAEGASAFMRKSGRFPLAGRGDVNTFAVFAEAADGLCSPNSRVGLFLPLGIISDATCSEFTFELLTERRMVAVIGFRNEKKLFAEVLHNFKFCLFVFGESNVSKACDCIVDCLELTELAVRERWFSVDAETVLALNPESRTFPLFLDRRSVPIQLQATTKMGLLSASKTSWGAKLFTLFHMSNDSHTFSRYEKGDGRYPLLEARLIGQFNHRYSSYDLTNEDRPHMLPVVPSEYLADPNYKVSTYYSVDSEIAEAEWDKRAKRPWAIALRETTVAAASRTIVATVVPRCAANHKLLLTSLESSHPQLVTVFLGILNSFVFDFFARQKLGGSSLSAYLMEQLPFPSPNHIAECAPDFLDSGGLVKFVVPRVLELVYTADDLQLFAHDVGYASNPFVWDEERRFWLRAELDAVFFHLYGIARNDVDYIMETFPIVKRKDIAAHGSYRTKEAILSIYDEMAEAMT